MPVGSAPRRHLFAIFLLLVATAGAASAAPIDVLIVAPHPDDDTITAAGITARAKAHGHTVRIVHVTNGDYPDGPVQGLRREGEAVDAATSLGMLEDELIFLGYPDYYLKEIDQNYPGAGDQFTAPWGQSVTYASRGLGGTDYHTYRFGSPAAYNRANLVVDLTDLLQDLRPAHVLLPSEWDQHHDHYTTYSLVSEAIAAIHAGDPTYAPTVHKTIVWSDDINEDPVWPAPLDPTVPHVEVHDLAQTDLVWADRESIDVPLAMQSPVLEENPKAIAIEAIPTQGGTSGFLGRFVHKDEFYWVENQVGTNQPPRVAAGADQTVSEGVTVSLDATGSSDPESAPLTYQWTQVEGAPVTLSDPSASGPTFVAPTGLPEDDYLGFELTVGDGVFTSLPDLVLVKVHAAQPIVPENIAPVAGVGASSENAAAGQQAIKAVDRVVAGYPADPTHEWATLGEREGAWIQLGWSRPYSIDRITLHDRPNVDDRILGGTLLFSDAATLAVGALDDLGAGLDTNLAPKLVTSLRFTVGATSASTTSVGLAEIEVYRTPSRDWDDDDWTISDGDCNDDDATVHPGVSDASCDGIDQNCVGGADEGYVPVATTCGVGACAATGSTSCVAGVVVDGCTPGTPSSDTCDGIDNDCNGTTDDGPLPGLVAGVAVTASSLSWQALPDSTSYDVVRGSLNALAPTQGDFAQAIRACVANDVAATTVTYSVTLMPGRGAFFLVRGKNCVGAGSYDEPGQSGSRDAEILASGLACP